MNRLILVLLAAANSMVLVAGDFFECPPAPASTPVSSPYLRAHSAPLRSESPVFRSLPPSIRSGAGVVQIQYIDQEYKKLLREFQSIKIQSDQGIAIASLLDLKEQALKLRAEAKELNIESYNEKFSQFTKAVALFIKSLFPQSPSSQRREVGKQE